MPAPNSSLQNLRRRLLVVDDDPGVGAYLQRLFEDTRRFSVEFEPDPSIAVVTARVYQPALLILDVVMPGMSGVVLASHLRSEPRLRDLPILLFTGALGRARPPGIAPGAAPLEYLAKGVPGAVVIATVDRLLARAAAGGAAAQSAM